MIRLPANITEWAHLARTGPEAIVLGFDLPNLPISPSESFDRFVPGRGAWTDLLPLKRWLADAPQVVDPPVLVEVGLTLCRPVSPQDMLAIDRQLHGVGVAEGPAGLVVDNGKHPVLAKDQIDHTQAWRQTTPQGQHEWLLDPDHFPVGPGVLAKQFHGAAKMQPIRLVVVGLDQPVESAGPNCRAACDTAVQPGRGLVKYPALDEVRRFGPKPDPLDVLQVIAVGTELDGGNLAVTQIGHPVSPQPLREAHDSASVAGKGRGDSPVSGLNHCSHLSRHRSSSEADTLGVSFIWISPRHVRDAHSFEEILEVARFVAPAVVFLEDLDLFAEERDTNGWTGLGELMNQLDGAVDNEGIVTLATTNRLEVIEKALRNRPGRFDRVITMESMDGVCRRQMLRHELRNARISPADRDHLVEATDDYTGAQVEELANTVYILALARENMSCSSQMMHRLDGGLAEGATSADVLVDRRLIDSALGEMHVERKAKLGFHVA